MIDLANLKAEGFEAVLESAGRAPKACPRAQFGAITRRPIASLRSAHRDCGDSTCKNAVNSPSRAGHKSGNYREGLWQNCHRLNSILVGSLNTFLRNRGVGRNPGLQLMRDKRRRILLI